MEHHVQSVTDVPCVVSPVHAHQPQSSRAAMLSQLVASYHLLLSSLFAILLQPAASYPLLLTSHAAKMPHLVVSCLLQLISLSAKMPLCVASPSQLLSACPSTQIPTPSSLSSPVLPSFHSSQLPQLIPFLTAYREAPFALVPAAQNPHDVSVAHPYVSVAQLPPYASQLPLYATQLQMLPYVSEPQSQLRNVVAPTYLFVLATQTQLPVSQLSLSCQQC